MDDKCPVCGKGRFGKFKSEPEEDRHYLVSHLDCVLKLQHNMNAGTPGHALGYDCCLERKQAEAEVAKLRWMLEDFIAPEIRDEVIADLARRWEDHHD